ncbi:hypothetical protein M407DRAFT_28224 [Tulasnella calospora MUT 4182]|uniref:Uncharacterized protein n=1 Tax=Tulasnella calospora MUT 4182 TaxID=1051891 RepID=A0A0C3KLM0_9AGAM|nr:hypothetical protein M407DRAFT_28224 [Tulasnella calospora MUT 4182]
MASTNSSRTAVERMSDDDGCGAPQVQLAERWNGLDLPTGLSGVVLWVKRP